MVYNFLCHFCLQIFPNSTNLRHFLQKILLFWKIDNKFNKERLKTQEKTQNSRKKLKTQGKNSKLKKILRFLASLKTIDGRDFAQKKSLTYICFFKLLSLLFSQF